MVNVEDWVVSFRWVKKMGVCLFHGSEINPYASRFSGCLNLLGMIDIHVCINISNKVVYIAIDVCICVLMGIHSTLLLCV